MMIPSASLALLIAFAQGDSWEDAHAMAPGSERGESIAALLLLQDGEIEASNLGLAWEAGKRAAEDLELDLALRIQSSLFERMPAEWSGVNLALTFQRLGLWSEADLVMGTMIETLTLEDPGAIWSQRGIFALGAGEHLTAREFFGHAVCLGSADATSILAREDLAKHHTTQSRSGFRAALAGNPEHPWALRGWGLSLLGSSKLPTGDMHQN